MYDDDTVGMRKGTCGHSRAIKTKMKMSASGKTGSTLRAGQRRNHSSRRQSPSRTSSHVCSSTSPSSPITPGLRIGRTTTISPSHDSTRPTVSTGPGVHVAGSMPRA